MATVDPHYFQAALRCAARQGVGVNEILSQAGIDQEREKGSPRVRGELLTKLIQAVWAALDDEFMGCTKSPCKRGAFAFMARHILHYETLEAVLRQGIEFYNLFTDDIQMQLVVANNTAVIEVKFSHPEFDPDHFFQEFWLVIWHRFSSWIVGRRIALKQVHFSHAIPTHNSELKYLFPCRHFFKRAVLSLSFNAEMLTLPPVRTARDLSRFLNNSPADLMTIPGDETSYSMRIRSLLHNQQSTELRCPTLQQIAASYGISTQTLRRRLKREATSYPEIKDNYRRDLAIEKLRFEKLPVAETARLLGFSEPRSFSRAFKHWTGHTPTDFLQLKK